MTDSNGHERCIVVGVDGSPASEAALEWGARQAKLTGAPLRAVMVWHVPMAGYGMAMPAPIKADIAHDAQVALDDVVAEVLGEAQPVGVTKAVIQGHPASELVKAATGAELLVVGSRGHGAVAGTLLGSVSRHCVTHAACPVVVVSDRDR
jgi:nucleotide-binding universal stress UspA family protein